MPRPLALGTRLSRSLLILGGLVLLGAAGQEDPPVPAPANQGAVAPVAIEAGPRATKKTTRRHVAEGKLSYFRVGMSFDETPLKEALRTFFKALELDYAPYFRGPSSDSGMVGETPITIETASISAHRGLDLILATAELGESYTWQLRGSIVEVGTKSRLARSGEKRPVVYPLKDLTLDIPYFDSSPHPNNQTERLMPREMAAQLMHHIATSVHPEGWLPPTLDDDQAVPPSSPNGGTEWANLTPYLLERSTGRKLKPLELFTIGRWARMHYHRDDLLVTAPDFIHRALDGYPRAVMPDPAHWKLPVVEPVKDS